MRKSGIRYHKNPLLAYSVEMLIKLSISTRVGYLRAKHHQVKVKYLKVKKMVKFDIEIFLGTKIPIKYLVISM